VRRYLLASVVVLLSFAEGCSHYSCDGLQFSRLDVVPRGAIIVTDADERAHSSLAWVAEQIAEGKQSAQTDGRSRMDDFYKYSRDRNLDLAGVPTPSFVVHGVPVIIRGVNNCLI
jgi:hypothetical protein